jgi:hypothetical protein
MLAALGQADEAVQSRQSLLQLGWAVVEATVVVYYH